MRPFSNEAYYLLFSALANRTRLAILDVLKDGPKTIFEISKDLKLREATVTNNIKPLQESMVVTSQKTTKKHLFSLNKEIMEPLSDILSFHVNKYCPGLGKCIPPNKLKEYMKQEASRKTYIEHG